MAAQHEVAALAALPLSLLPNPWNPIIPIMIAVGFSYLGTAIFATRRRDILELFRGRNAGKQEAEEGSLTPSRQVLLDTSVIIDGRIADISQTGFVNGPMLVPQEISRDGVHSRCCWWDLGMCSSLVVCPPRR